MASRSNGGSPVGQGLISIMLRNSNLRPWCEAVRNMGWNSKIPARQAALRGGAEGLIGTMMGAIHMFRSRRSPMLHRRVPTIRKRSFAYLAELERWLALEIAGVYHNSIHSSLGRSPIEVERGGERAQVDDPTTVRYRTITYKSSCR